MAKIKVAEIFHSLQGEGRRTPKAWRGKAPVDLGFKRITDGED